jgi:hypothetical protein
MVDVVHVVERSQKQNTQKSSFEATLLLPMPL